MDNNEDKNSLNIFSEKHIDEASLIYILYV